ncbi:MAG: twin-arginine translocation signal domain-containing protein [Pseudomonadota bacterium]
MATTRRGFLKVGALAALALAAGGGIYRLTRAPAVPGPFVLDGEARSALEAMVPAMLGAALPLEAGARAAAIKTTTLHVHQAILGLPRATQKELQDLFGLLALGPARRFLAGVPEGWGSASAEQVGAFLQSWRTHRLAMLQTAYHGLHDLIIGSWYADPASWNAIGYPGPMPQLS